MLRLVIWKIVMVWKHMLDAMLRLLLILKPDGH